jgi:pimeloyl-ACP methyl ester carboxylesterase
MPTARIDGTSFRYELQGSGPPLVLISGYSCDHQFWLPVVPKLSERFTTLLFDNRGVGFTDDDGSPLSAESMADDTVALARHLGWDRARVVGQSMGGSIAQCVAARHPRFVERLALVTTSPFWSRFSYLALKSVFQLRQAAVDAELVADVTMPWLFGETFLRDVAGAEAFKQLGLANPVRQTEEDQARQLRVLETFDGRPYLGAIEAPTLILYAAEDLVAPRREALLLQAGIRGSQVEELPCGHVVTAEAPALLAERLLAFL